MNNNFKNFFTVYERVFHGSPHEITNGFDYDKIGSGHGAQSFGWGFYFAENQGTATSYVPSSFKKNYRYKGKDGLFWYDYYQNKGDYSKATIWEYILLHKSKDTIAHLLEDGEEEALAYLKTLPDKLFAPPGGFLYTIDLDIDENRLLHWRESFENQTEVVKNILLKYKDIIENGVNYTRNSGKLENLKGFEIYYGIREAFSIPEENGGLENSEYDRYYPKEKNASLTLLKWGIQGTMYFDTTYNNSRNIVVFDKDAIHIVDKK